MKAQPVGTTHPAAEPGGWQPPDATVRTDPDRRKRTVTDTMQYVAIGVPEATMPTAPPSAPARPATPIVPLPTGTYRVRRQPGRGPVPTGTHRVRREPGR
ncbi:hypothetical protein GA0070608_0700 [Micromonospora peucetia]|uniref:Uncharacterized protein n=1 Tax=Micromonospora peucetia TaxID=47871 RepID=A0A1C6U941_9ACTN|nr:hypothetical protein GA0070608_0700 [Micromonospora peucetia]